MAKPRMTGSPGPIPQALDYDYDPKYGFSIRTPMRGTIAAMMGLSGQLTLVGVAHNYRELGDGNAEVTSRAQTVPGDPNNETPIDGWQILGNIVDKDIYQHPTLLAANEQDIADLQDAVEEKNLVDCPVGLEKFFALLLRGTTHYETVNYVLRHTQTVSSQYSKDILDTNTFKIYSSAKLLTECATYTRPLPGRFVNKINAIPAPAAQDDYLWGWFKQPSTENTAANNTIEITNDYVLDQWSTVLYPNPIV